VVSDWTHVPMSNLPAVVVPAPACAAVPDTLISRPLIWLEKFAFVGKLRSFKGNKISTSTRAQTL